jgi:HAD superfamily hydrolase (TIGR01509 family)
MPPTLPIPCPPAAVLFDMDGVLVDTFDAWVAVIDESRSRRALAPLGPGGVRACWGQGLLADCQTIFPGEDPARLAAEYDAGFLKHLARVRPEPGAIDAVRTLRAAGCRTAVVTNSPVALAERIVRLIDLEGGFDAIAGGDEVPKGKPDPDLVLLALGRLDAEASRAVLVGDTRLDLEAGRAAGVAVVGYRLDGADARIEHLHELGPRLGVVR